MTEPPLTPGTPDEALMPRIAAGDALAFAELFRRRQGEVYRFALHMSASTSMAEDVTQDVFLQVMRDAARFEPARGAVGPWLFGIAKNFVRRRFERERAHQPLVDEDTGQEIDVPAVCADPLTDITTAERLETLRRAILTLPLLYREVLVLCDLQEMPYVGAAATLGCAVGTVRSRLHRGRTLLAAKMSALEKLPATEDVNPRPSGRGGARCFA
jgi:RNA polymerase sigma-70 factor (ECF subfamily)